MEHDALALEVIDQGSARRRLWDLEEAIEDLIGID